MRSFIKLVIWFVLVFFTLLFMVIESTEYFVNRNANFKLAKNPKYIVVGHSHSECAFNDSLINNFVNLSESGESYFYTYFKLEKVLNQNPSIKTVFIEFTNNQIDKSIEKNIFDGKYMNYRYPEYSSFMSFSDKQLLIKNNFSVFVNANSLAFKTNLSRVLRQDFEYSDKMGGYLYLVRDKTDSLLKNKKMKKPIEYDFSEYSMHYLSKIVKLCKEKKVAPVLIRSPLHEKYIGYYNEEDYKRILNTRFKNIEYLDYSKFPLKNKEFGDLQHLNYRGAKVFSERFNTVLKERSIKN